MNKQRFNYSPRFYSSVEERARATATEVFKVLKVYLEIESIIDIGCGSGAWLEAALESGIKKATGMDLSSSIEVVQNNPKLEPYISDKSLTLIVRDFVADSTTSFAESDLAICLEVVEHLPEQVGLDLVQLLTESANFVIFSGAQPGQGGTYHINERPLTYWVEEFKKYSFVPYDPFRSKLQEQQKLPRFYALNMLLFVNQKVIDTSKLVLNPERLASCCVVDVKQLDNRTVVEKIRYWFISKLPQVVVTYISGHVKY